MIYLTKPKSGDQYVLNSDLIETITAHHETHITLVDGRHYIAAESVEDIVFAIQQFRASIQSLSHLIDQTPGAEQAASRGLRAVPQLPKDGN